jgi:hypothetical protein
MDELAIAISVVTMHAECCMSRVCIGILVISICTRDSQCDAGRTPAGGLLEIFSCRWRWVRRARTMNALRFEDVPGNRTQVRGPPKNQKCLYIFVL